MTSDWLIDLHNVNFSNSLEQKITVEFAAIPILLPSKSLVEIRKMF